MKTLKHLLVAIITLTLFSCSSDSTSPDSEKPTISIVKPTDEQSVLAGENLAVEIAFSDNVELASYKIEIHYSGDGHSHNRLNTPNEDIPWNYHSEGNLSGKNDIIHSTVQVPINAENGIYHFGVYALDRAGNQQSDWVEFEIHHLLD